MRKFSKINESIEDKDEKICQQCNLPFTWRKKWEKEWENVKYCSERCKKSKK